MPPAPKITTGPLITVRCTNDDCAQYDKAQTVPSGISLSATVLLTGTLACSVCGTALEPLAGNGEPRR